jgi:hypothetical protein
MLRRYAPARNITEIGEYTMEIIGFILKYGFVTALIVEGILIGRALIRLAREKARTDGDSA